MGYEGCYAAGDRNTEYKDVTDLHRFFNGWGTLMVLTFMMGYEGCYAAVDRNTDNRDGKDLDGFFAVSGTLIDMIFMMGYERCYAAGDRSVCCPLRCAPLCLCAVVVQIFNHR